MLLEKDLHMQLLLAIPFLGELAIDECTYLGWQMIVFGDC